VKVARAIAKSSVFALANSDAALRNHWKMYPETKPQVVNDETFRQARHIFDSRIELTKLELRASSRSDTRGMLGMTQADGTRISAGPQDVQLHVTIAAQGVPAERLRALVEESHRCSPVPCALQEETPVGLHIEIAGS